jgi:5-methyltetrahydrofolate--homocysteine methyltransferase
MAIQDLYNAVTEFEDDIIGDLVQKELDAGTDISSILNDGLISPMDQVGDEFAKGNLFVPEMLLAARTMKMGLEVIKPHLNASNSKSRGTIVTGTIKNDFHDVGKNLVVIMLEGSGFTVIDLGADVSASAFVESAKENNAQIIGISALLTTTMLGMENVVELVKQEGMDTKILIGGAPVTKKFADEIGADGYSSDAPGAVKLARQFIPVV